MGGMSIWHWLVVGGIALLLFGGKGKISDIMGDVAKGIKSFKSNMKEQTEESSDDQKIEADSTPAAPVVQDEHTAAKS